MSAICTDALAEAQKAASDAEAASKAYSGLPPLGDSNDKEYSGNMKRHEKAKGVAEEKATLARKAFQKAQSMLSLSEAAGLVANMNSKHAPATKVKANSSMAQALQKVDKKEQKLSGKVNKVEMKQQSLAQQLAQTDKEEMSLLQRLQVETRLRKTDEQYEASTVAELKKRVTQLEDKESPAALQKKLKTEKKELKEVETKLNEKQHQLSQTEHQLSRSEDHKLESKVPAVHAVKVSSGHTDSPTPKSDSASPVSDASKSDSPTSTSDPVTSKSVQNPNPQPASVNDFHMLMVPEVKLDQQK